MPERAMDILGYQTMTVLSPSMEPDIKVNDTIVIRRVNTDNIEVGDIVTFEMYIPELRMNGYVTHYIGQIEEVDGETVFYTHGAGVEPGTFDKWRLADGTYKDVTEDDIVGQYWFKIPMIGYVTNNPTILFVVLINVVVIYFGVSYIRGNQKDEE
jgi:signal peptidase